MIINVYYIVSSVPTIMAPAETTPGATKNPQKVKYLSRKQANALIIDSGIAIQAALEHLEQARALAAKAGLSVDSNILPTSTVDPNLPLAVNDTGGHSNTDHVVVRTGNQRQDRLSELKRNLWRRHRAIKPENRGEDRWDKPRIPGERRRRIVREKDSPEAPPDPPHTGYVVFVGQMTTKIRHDRPNVPHDQARGKKREQSLVPFLSRKPQNSHISFLLSSQSCKKFPKFGGLE
jgi:hypothetical protein